MITLLKEITNSAINLTCDGKVVLSTKNMMPAAMGAKSGNLNLCFKCPGRSTTRRDFVFPFFFEMEKMKINEEKEKKRKREKEGKLHQQWVSSLHLV